MAIVVVEVEGAVGEVRVEAVEGGKNAGKGGRSTKWIPPKQRLNIRRFSTSMITGFTKDQIQQH